eukprot:8068712-Karenia_brevis.AAC.1
MRAGSLPHSLVSFSAARGHASPPSLDAIAICREAQASLEDFNSQDASHIMRIEVHIEDDNPGTGKISFNAAISACEKNGQWQIGTPSLVELCRGGLPLKVISFSAAISAYKKDGQWQRVMPLLAAMRAEGLPPSMDSFSAASGHASPPSLDAMAFTS